ncbi:3-phosphoshikimate 1-carboxyvinyltransferase [candidate division KSB1 bacterium]
MVIQTIIPGGNIQGIITVPGDKSISIRSVLFASIADGTSSITGAGTGGDVASAVKCIKQLGVDTRSEGDTLFINGKNLTGFLPVQTPIDCGNSGTTFRLLSGLLAGQQHSYTITGDESLRNRPMKRIIDPLQRMGASIKSADNNKAPITVSPSDLHGITYELPVSSAQVKSAILLAGLFADGRTTVIEPGASRNHTELMLSAMGVSVTHDENRITIARPERIIPCDIHVPGDISSAAFFIVLGSLLPGSHIIIRNVGVNPTRTGIIDILTLMGAKITFSNHRTEAGEPAADIEVRPSKLKGLEVGGPDIPRLIDEIPILAVAAAFAEGETSVRDAGELRVKESDRINAVCTNLRKMGAKIEELQDGMVIEGGHPLHGAEISSYEDHRIALSFAIAGLLARGHTVIHGSEWTDISFPGFFAALERIRHIN